MRQLKPEASMIVDCSIAYLIKKKIFWIALKFHWNIFCETNL